MFFLHIDHKKNKVIDNHNLEGLKLYSNTLTWAPYFIITNCDDNGQNCEIKGILNDYMNAMGRILNFSWTSHAPPDGNVCNLSVAHSMKVVSGVELWEVLSMVNII